MRRSPRTTRNRSGLIAAALLCAPLFAGSIEGRVTDSVTGEPVTGASVRILDQHSYVFEATTDASGSYRRAGLDDGNYHAEVSKDGFAEGRGPDKQSVVDIGGGSVRVSGDVPLRLDVQLNPWGSVSGRVVDEDGKPAPMVRVQISNVLDSDVFTDDNGGFKFINLRPASYTLVAKPRPDTHVKDGERVGAVPIYYPSATQLSEAAAVQVTWGSNVAGLEIRLRDVPVHRVSGVVLDPAGKPAANATVRLLGQSPPGRGRGWIGFGATAAPTGGATAQIVFTTVTAEAGPMREPEVAQVDTKPDGSFEFPAVESGEWRVTASADEYTGTPFFAVSAASIGDKDLTLELRLSAPALVPVQPDWGDAKAPDGWQSGDGLISFRGMEGQPPSPVTEGERRIPGILGGRYEIAAGRAPFGFYVAQVLMGGADMLGKVVDVIPGAGGFRVMLKHDAGSVRGTAENGEGGSVFLVPRSAGDAIQYSAQPIRAGGAFTFANVAPGEYYVVAFGRSNLNELPPENLPASIANMATGVTVESGSQASVEVKLNRWPF